MFYTRNMSKNAIGVLGVAVVAIIIGGSIFIFDNDDYFKSIDVARTDSQSSAIEMPFTTIKEGRQSSVNTRVNYIITSANQLEELWEIVNVPGTPPRVDFNKQSVVAVFSGSGPSSKIAVADIKDTNVRTVSIIVTTPDTMCAQKDYSDTSPYEIVIMPATSLPLAHKDTATTTCNSW